LIVDGTAQELELAPGSNIIGRSPESELQLLDQGVSRRHVDVHVADGRSVLYDLGSTNGTSVNGHTVQSQELQHGDVIRLGHSRLIYHQDGS
jgi:pSer/pThr/pTyr-binding forkhead associated (FHA) protein